MNNEKIISKIKKASTFGMIAIPVYLLFPLFCIFMSVSKILTDGRNAATIDEDWEPMFGAFGLIAGCILAIGLFFVLIYALINIYRILIWLKKSDSPFEMKFSKELRDIGIAFMLIEPVTAICTLCLGSIVEISDGFLTFGAGVLLYIISQIFRYGTELQRESDETL